MKSARSEAWHIDFETYSEIDLPAAGTFRYAEDPSTEALLLSFCGPGHPRPVIVDLTVPGFLKKLEPLFQAIKRGVRLCAHHATFERLIWTLVCQFPITPKPEQWDCTAARARAIAIPGSLDGAASALGLNVRKDSKGVALIQKFCKPQTDRKTKERFRIYPKDDPEAWAAFKEYCIQDVMVERELDHILPPLSDIERRTYELDFKINQRGMPVNMELVRKAKQYVEEYVLEMSEWTERIMGCRPTQRDKTLAYFASRGYKLPNLQAATVEKLAEKKGLPPDLKRLLDCRIELSRAGVKKFNAIETCVSLDGRIRGGFMYSAASTKRWSSTGVQMHNLQKPEGEEEGGETNVAVCLSLIENDPEDLSIIFDRPLSVISQSIRGFFQSDRNFIVADYKSVEPRGLAWYAGEQWILDAYMRGEDLYKVTAARVYDLDIKDIDDFLRFMGKQLFLGAGYGMGPPRFQQTCSKFGKHIDLDSSINAIYGYRASVPNIMSFHKNLEKAIIRCFNRGHPVELGDKFVFRPETLSNGFEVVFVDMPSGTIAYPKPFLTTEEWNGEEHYVFNFYTPVNGHGFIKTDTFGGSLAENVTQAGTRDILRDGMLACDDAGFEVCGHCHDEAIAEGEGTEEEIKEFSHLLCHSSTWAKRFPIDASTYISKLYKK